MVQIAIGFLAFVLSSVQLCFGEENTFIGLQHKCIEGASFVTTATGTMQTVGGINTYVALPPPGLRRSTSEAIVLLTDVFGLASNDNKLLADNFAAAGFATYAPDYLNGDPIPESAANFNITQWLARHGTAQTLPPLLNVINAIRAQGITKLAATGYCFGGLYATILAQNNTVEVSAMAHPSLLTIPADQNTLKAQSKVPVQIHNGELDTILTPALALQVDGVLGNGQYTPGYSRSQWPGVGHGFAIRADPTKPAEVAAKEGAFNQTLLWFQTNLANAPSNGRNHAVRSTDTPVASVLLALVAILALSA